MLGVQDAAFLNAIGYVLMALLCLGGLLSIVLAVVSCIKQRKAKSTKVAPADQFKDVSGDEV